MKFFSRRFMLYCLALLSCVPIVCFLIGLNVIEMYVALLSVAIGMVIGRALSFYFLFGGK